MKTLLQTLLVITVLGALGASTVVAFQTTTLPSNPKLYVVIVFDQMRGDYPQTFSRFIGEGGFAEFKKNGAVFLNAKFEQANTITGPGHAAISTGQYASGNGITGNEFCLGPNEECVRCIGEAQGGETSGYIQVPTMASELIRQKPGSKVISIAHKDRSAILLASSNSTACLWMDADCKLTTSTNFKKPSWLSALNKQISASKYQFKTWNMVIPQNKNPEMDDQIGEGSFSSGKHVFPYKLPRYGSDSYSADFLMSPYSVEWIFDIAQYVVKKERLGKGSHPDVLYVGVSSPDYLGHTFGPNSREVQEMYVACNEQIKKFITFLDRQLQRKNYILVVTSDHGVGPIPEQIKRNTQPGVPSIDAGRLSTKVIKRYLDSTLSRQFNAPDSTKWIRAIIPPCVHFELNVVASNNVPSDSIYNVAQRALLSLNGIGIAITAKELAVGNCAPNIDQEMCQLIRNSFHATRSGQLLFYPKPYWIFGTNPASHGTPYDYDRWVPLMMLGGNIKRQESNAKVSPVDITPTLCRMLGIQMAPLNGSPLPLK